MLKVVPARSVTRRTFLATAASGTMVRDVGYAQETQAARTARIAITLDLEMSRVYPKRDMMEWDFQKGNLNEPTKKYALDAA